MFLLYNKYPTNAIKKKKEKILEYNLNGDISDEEFISRNKGYTKQIIDLEIEISKLVPEDVELQIAEKQLSKITEELKSFKEVKEEDINRQIIDKLFDKIVVSLSADKQTMCKFYLSTGCLKIRDLGGVVLNTCYLTIRKNDTRHFIGELVA